MVTYRTKSLDLLVHANSNIVWDAFKVKDVGRERLPIVLLPHPDFHLHLRVHAPSSCPRLAIFTGPRCFLRLCDSLDANSLPERGLLLLHWLLGTDGSLWDRIDSLFLWSRLSKGKLAHEVCRPLAFTVGIRSGRPVVVGGV